MKDYTDIIYTPVITEKASNIAGSGKTYVFKVNKKASKFQIKKAFEEAFGVHVIKINTLNTKPKDRKTYKKAIITLKDGESIEI